MAAGLLGYLLPTPGTAPLSETLPPKASGGFAGYGRFTGDRARNWLGLGSSTLAGQRGDAIIYPELAAEFYTVVMQVKAGQDRSKAFQQFARRTGIEDIKSLSAMIVQSERFGTSLSQALKVYADSLRQRRRLRSEAAVAKAGIKMLFPIILFILPALFVITLVPGVLSVLRDLKGGIGNK